MFGKMPLRLNRAVVITMFALVHILSAQTPELDLAQKQIDANNLAAAHRPSIPTSKNTPQALRPGSSAVTSPISFTTTAPPSPTTIWKKRTVCLQPCSPIAAPVPT